MVGLGEKEKEKKGKPGRAGPEKAATLEVAGRAACSPCKGLRERSSRRAPGGTPGAIRENFPGQGRPPTGGQISPEIAIWPDSRRETARCQQGARERNVCAGLGLGSDNPWLTLQAEGCGQMVDTGSASEGRIPGDVKVGRKHSGSGLERQRQRAAAC